LTKRSWNSLEPVEKAYWSLGYCAIAGVDEVGRGAIAGPLLVSGLILPKDYHHPLLKDSKELTPKQREKIAEELRKVAVSFSFAWVEVEEIRRLGIFKAFLLGLEKAIQGLTKPDLILIDGPHPLPNFQGLQKALVKGDKLSLNIAGASILAKVERDRLMEELDKLYPDYGFAKHKGYATKEHISALKKLGPSPIHRTSYHCFAQWLTKKEA